MNDEPPILTDRVDDVPLFQVQFPKHVGAYHVGEFDHVREDGHVTHYSGLSIQLLKKPRWLHRQMMRWAFGWRWRDAE